MAVKYPRKLKVQIYQYWLANGCSYRELATMFGVSGPFYVSKIIKEIERGPDVPSVIREEGMYEDGTQKDDSPEGRIKWLMRTLDSSRSLWLEYKGSGLSKTQFAKSKGIGNRELKDLLLWGMGYEVGVWDSMLKKKSQRKTKCGWNSLSIEERKRRIAHLMETCNDPSITAEDAVLIETLLGSKADAKTE